MPIFEYTCSKCSGKFELLMSTSERDSAVCPKCGTKSLKREISSFAVAGVERGKGAGGDSCTSCSTTSCST